jgi:5-methylcytosine-specific restriction endonuclease McrA
MARLSRLPTLINAAPRAVGYSTPAAAERARDKARWQANSLRALYSQKRWRALRLVILDRDLWTCLQTGVLLTGKAPAPHSAVVDHIVPHRGSLALFWDPANLQSVSKEYHDTEKQRIEAATRARI